MDELADRIIRAMSDKLDEKFMAIGGEAACTDQTSPGSRDLRCQTCGGSGLVTQVPYVRDALASCMACRGLGRRV